MGSTEPTDNLDETPDLNLGSEVDGVLTDCRRLEPRSDFFASVKSRIKIAEERQTQMKKGRKSIVIWSILAHAAVFALLANIFIGPEASKPTETVSLEKQLYHARDTASKSALETGISSTGHVQVPSLKAGEGVRLVPLKNCIAVFAHTQWHKLTNKVQRAYRDEGSFAIEKAGQGGKLFVSETLRQNYFKTSTKAVFLSFTGRTELWDADHLAAYLREYPIDIRRSACIIPINF